MTDDHPYSTWLRTATAIALGLAVPAMVSGRAVLQGLAAAALIAVLVIAWQDRRIFAQAGTAIRSRFCIMVLIAFAAMAVSIPGSLDPFRSFDAWARTLAYIGGCTLFWAFLYGDARAGTLCRRVLILGCAAGIGLVACAQLGLTWPLQAVRNTFGPVSDLWALHAPKAYASAMSCAVPVLIWCAWHETGKWRWLGGLAAAGAIAVIIGTANRSAIAGLLAMILVGSLAISLRHSRPWVWIWAFGAAGMLTATFILIQMLPDAPSSTAVWDWIPAWLVDTHRQQIWHFVGGKIAESPWFGYGINVIERIPGAHEKIPGYRVEYVPSHPHNWTLEVLGETGIIGFVPVLLTLIWWLARHFKGHLVSGSPATLAQTGLIAVFWGSSLFNFSIWSSWWLITFFLLTAVIAAGPASGAQASARDESRVSAP
ncbi:MAG: O-antigen ligase family protein [Rhodospirillales bacterium]